MSLRIAKVNKEIQRVISKVIQEEADLPAEALVTVMRVETTKNLRSAKVWLSIFPEQKEKGIMAALKKQMYDLQGTFNRQIILQPLPRLTFLLDKN